MKNLCNKKIILTGGGTVGSVSPLLAVYDELRLRGDYDFLWIGSRDGLEKEIIARESIDFVGISSGKLRRYFSFQNFIDIFKIFFGFLESIFIIIKGKPDLIMSAGSFVSVPLVWAGWILRVPVLIHQLDARPGLANKLMVRVAKKISLTFEKSLNDYGTKAVWTGNPIRKSFLDKNLNVLEIKKELKLNLDLPLILVVGGGTGSKKINEIIISIVPNLIERAEIVHVTGKNRLEKKVSFKVPLKVPFQKYHQYEFLDADLMAKYLFVADLIISRAGMGFLSELAYLKKASIIIPMPNSHQEDNAQILSDHKAALVLHEKEIDKNILYQEIIKILENDDLRHDLEKNIGGAIKCGEEAVNNIIKIIEEIII